MASTADARLTAPLGVAALALASALWYLASGTDPLPLAAWLAPVPVFALAPRLTARATFAGALLVRTIGGLALWPYLHGALHVPTPIAVVALVAPALLSALTAVWLRTLARRHAPWVAALGTGAMAATLDMLVARVSVHGTFLSQAYTQVTVLPIAQLAAIGGTSMIVFALTTVAAGVGLSLDGASPWAQRRKSATVAAGVLAITLAFGLTRLASSAEDGRPLRVAMLAADAPNDPVPASSASGQSLLQRYDAKIRALPLDSLDAIVLPERTTTFDTLSERAWTARFSTIAREHGAIIVLGATPAATRPAHNTAWVFRTDGAIDQYFKQHLLPPYESRFSPGFDLVTVARSATGTLGVMICKDADFPALGRRYATAGVGAMLIPAWDFGVDGMLHARMAMLRGIEGGFAVVRSARRGALTASDAYGRVLGVQASNAAPMSVLRASVPQYRLRTLYARLGDAWGMACAFAVMLLGAHAVFVRRSRPS